MKQLSPRELASRIARETDGIVIRQGTTNGKAVLHLQRQRNIDNGIEAASVTIPASVMEWELHDWNPTNKKKKKEKA